MKRMMMTAAALMFSTSAMAWVPAQEKAATTQADMSMSAGMSKSTGAKTYAAADWSDGNAMGDTKSADSMALVAGDMKGSDLAIASTGSAKMDGFSTDGMAGMKMASLDKVPNDMDMAMEADADAGAKFAGAKIADDMAWSGKGESTMPAMADAGLDTGTYTGEGGPLEEIQAYPACRPGRGDDRCIQLYEVGSRKNLMASSDSARAPTQLGMGGPFEPVPEANGKTEAAAPAEDHSGHAATTATAKPTTDEGADDESFEENTANPPAGKPDMADATGGGMTKTIK